MQQIHPNIMTLLFLSLLLGFSQWSLASKKTTESLAISAETCIQTFNTYGPWYAPKLEERTKSLGLYLETNPCDVLMFQEVWVKDHIDQLKTILTDLGYKVFHFDSIALSGKKFGLMSAVRGEILGQGFLEFDDNYDGFTDYLRKQLYVGKGVGILKVKTYEENNPIFIVNTHMHHSSTKIRSSQTKQLLSNIEALNKEKIPTILGGDFNFSKSSSNYKMISGTFINFDKGEECTYCESNLLAWGFEDRKIDHIFLTEDLSDRVTSGSITPKKWNGMYLSDHFGVRLYLRK